MSTPPISPLHTDQIPEDQRPWADEWARSLNGTSTSISDTLNGKITLSQNSVNDVYEVRVTGGVFPMTMRIGAGPPAVGATIIRAVEAQNKANIVSVFAVPFIEPKNDRIIIRNIKGLKKGTAYLVTLIVYREKVTPAQPAPSGAAANSSGDPNTNIITAWTPYAPVLSTSTNVAFNRASWRRVGDSMECFGVVKWSGAGAAGVFNVSIPTGYTMDSAKMPYVGASNVIGSCLYVDSGVNNLVGVTTTNTDGSMSNVIFVLDTFATGISAASSTANDAIFYRFTVPIAGWVSEI